MYKFILIICFVCAGSISKAQELNAKVTVVASQVGTAVSRSTFQTLQTALNNFMNNRKWTKDVFAANEKIDCNFLLNVSPTADANVYTATLTIQAARPVLNTTYQSPIINYRDESVIFKYTEYQQLDFNESRVSGTDPLQSNLTAVFAYYANLIIAFDYLSFSPKGGDPYFLKVQNIVNNAPDGRGIAGWKSFDGIRNRYWLIENILNSRYAIMHDVYYNYYRLAMDKLYENDKVARVEMLNVLNLLSAFNNENPNTMINQFFFQGKSNELVNIFSKGLPQEKMQAVEILSKLDLSNSAKYKEGIK